MAKTNDRLQILFKKFFPKESKALKLEEQKYLVVENSITGLWSSMDLFSFISRTIIYWGNWISCYSISYNGYSRIKSPLLWALLVCTVYNLPIRGTLTRLYQEIACPPLFLFGGKLNNPSLLIFALREKTSTNVSS